MKLTHTLTERERESFAELVSTTHGFNYSIPASAEKEGVSLPVCITPMVKHEQMF